MAGTYTGYPDTTTCTITIKDAGHRDSDGYEACQAHITAYYNS